MGKKRDRSARLKAKRWQIPVFLFLFIVGGSTLAVLLSLLKVGEGVGFINKVKVNHELIVVMKRKNYGFSFDEKTLITMDDKEVSGSELSHGTKIFFKYRGQVLDKPYVSEIKILSGGHKHGE